MFFKNVQLYRLPSGFPLAAEALAEALSEHAISPASSNELLRQGWQSIRPNGGLVHAVNKQFLIRLGSEKKLLPNTVVNQVAKARAAEMEEAQGYAIGKKSMKELKERVFDELLPRAFPIHGATDVWIDTVNGWLVVNSPYSGQGRRCYQASPEGCGWTGYTKSACPAFASGHHDRVVAGRYCASGLYGRYGYRTVRDW